MALNLDLHTHCFTGDELPDDFILARARAIARKRNRDESTTELAAKIRINSVDPHGSLLRRDLEAAGIDRAVIVGLDWGLLGGTGTSGRQHPADQLAWAADVVEAHGGYFRYIVGIDPRRPDAGSVLDQALRFDWVVGVKLYPPVGFRPTDQVCDPVYEAATRAGKFVMCHTGRQSFPFDLDCGRVERYSQVQRSHPDLRLVLAHAGFPFWGHEAIEVAVGHPTTYLDVSAWSRLMGQEDAKLDQFLSAAFKALGGQRVLFASDHSSGPRSHHEVSALLAWRERFVAVAQRCGIDETELAEASEAMLSPEVQVS